MPAKAKLVTRQSTTSTVTSDNLNKGSALEFAELDSNMINLRDQTFGVVGDDSATIDVAAGGTLYIQGGTNVTTATNSDGTITINSSAASDVFKTISVSGQSDVVADANTDTLTLAAGSNMTITTNAGTDTITFAASGGSASTGDVTFTDSTIGIGSSDRPLIMTAQGSDANSDGDGNVIQMLFKHIEYHNTNVYHSIKKGGDLVFRGNLSSGATADTGGFYPQIALREYEDNGSIEITPKPGQAVEIDGVNIQDNTISTNASNANLEISGNSSGNVIVEGMTLSSTSGTSDFGITVPTSQTLTLSAPSGTIDISSETVSLTSTLHVGAGGPGAGGILIEDNTIKTARSNEPLELAPAGTGEVHVQTSLKLATGATVTGILDEDAMGTNSATQLATQQSIKAYVDAEVSGVTAGQGWRVFGDDSAGVDIAEGGSLYIRGGDNITTATNSDGTITITGSASSGVSLSGSTNNTIATVTGSNALIGEANATFDGSTLAITGNITATTSIATDAISLDDNVIKTTRSNDDLRIAGSGTGLINISPTNDTVGDAYSTNSRYKHGTNIVYHNETCDASAMTGSGDREYVNNTIGKWKLTGGTSDSDARFRGAVNVGAIDLNQQTVSSTSRYAGVMASYHEAYATNTHATKGTLGQMTAIFAGNWVNGNEDMDITTSTCVLAEGWIEQYNDSDIELTTAYGYRYEGQGPGIYGSGGSVTITTEYGFHCGSLYGNTKWAFYDATNGQSLFGDVKINQNTISTNSSNANLELSGNSSGNVNILDGLQIGTGGATVTTILDEDAMGTNSATALATQQSIKAYADSVVNLIDEDDMSTDSATRPPSQQSVKAYVDGQNHTSLSGSTNNTIATVTGANALAGEANLTFDGSTLAVTGAATISTTLGVTGASTLDGVTITDNTISSNASNAQLEISANGTGRINIGNEDFTDDPGSLYNNAFGSTSNVKNTVIYHEDLTHDPGDDGRVYNSVIQTSLKTDGSDTASSNARFRVLLVNTGLDLNGSSITHSSIYRGAQAVNAQAFITNTSADDAVLSTATGFTGYIYVVPAGSSGDLTITNAIACGAATDFDAGNLASDKTLTITNSHNFYADTSYIYGGSATKVCTNHYAFYSKAQTIATNNWIFYDATSAGTNSQSRIGAIQLINQSSAPTNLANHSWIYALDDSASSEVYVKDEAGNATKISPHNKEGEWEYYSKNSKTGKTVRVNMERMIKKLEELTGETFIETN